MEEDVKCITDIKSEPPDEDAAEDPLAPRPSDFRFIELYNKTKQSNIKVDQREELKRESSLCGVANGDCALVDHNLDSNGDSEDASLSEGCINVGEKGTNRGRKKQYVCIVYPEENPSRQLNSGEKTDKKYFCCYCDFRSANIVIVHKHRTSVHTDIVPFTCTQCGYRAKKARDLSRHVSYMHRRKKLFKCNSLNCDYTSEDLSYMKKHVTDIHNNSHACDKCEFKAGSASGLKTHLSVIHGNLTIHTCDRCDYKSKILHHMKRHISAVHENEKPFTCTLCDYRSKRLTQLRRHIWSRHKDVNPYDRSAVCIKPSICTS